MPRVHCTVVVRGPIKLVAIGMFASTLYKLIKIQFVHGKLDVSYPFLIIRVNVKPVRDKMNIKQHHEVRVFGRRNGYTSGSEL